MTRSPFGPKTAIAAVAGDLFLVTRGTGESLEIEKLDPRTAATAALIATGIDAYLGSADWRTGGGGGATIMNGTGAPSGATGADGDFYINTSAWTIYGPKTSGAWGSATSLIGPAGDDGPAGADGAAILSGSGAPAGGVGANGDLYFDTAAKAFYGPKSGGSWGSAIPVKGDQGDEGDPGAPGAAVEMQKSATHIEWRYSGAPDWSELVALSTLVGPQGSQGIQGNPGAAGADGADGADGRAVLSGDGAPASGLGVNGDLYFDTTGKAIYTKAGGSWGSGVSLAGPQGIPGSAGADGNEVELGATATHIEWRYAGAPDWTQLVALSTLQGPQGAPGAQGNPGADGDDGAPGADGKTILNGSGAPSNALGTNGDFYLDIAAREIYGPKASGAWPAAVVLAGEDGTDGSNGKTVLSGAGAPAGGTGVDGDFYIDTGLWAIHGPKASGAWPAAVVLKPQVAVVTELPGSPDPNTFYVIEAA